MEELLWELRVWLDSYIPARILLFNKSKESRLLSAADQGNLNLVRKLIYAGADTNHRDAIGEMSSLDRAAARGFVEICKVLVEEGGADPNRANQFGWGPLHFAAVRGKLNVCKYLVEECVWIDPIDPTLETTAGWTPLKLAQKAKHEHIVKYFAEKINGEIRERKKIFFASLLKNPRLKHLVFKSQLYDRELVKSITGMVAKSCYDHGPLFPASELARRYVYAQRSRPHLGILTFYWIFIHLLVVGMLIIAFYFVRFIRFILNI